MAPVTDTPTDIDDLVTWLRAQLDEDEQWARAASAPYPYADGNPPMPSNGVHWEWVAGDRWEPATPDPVVSEHVADGDPVWLATRETWPVSYMGLDLPRMQTRRIYGEPTQEMNSAAAGHIMRHDPARVLAEVDAKRRILAGVEHYLDPHPGQPCTNEDEDDLYEPCELHVAHMKTAVTPYVLRLLALPYVDRPGYREEWTP